MDVVEALKASKLFAKFGDKGLGLMAKIAEVRSFPAGTPVFAASMMGESLFVVQSGEVQLELRVGNQMIELSRLGPGAHCGQLALLNPGPRLVGAVALSDCTLIEIQRKTFLKLHSLKPQISLKLMMAICEDYAEAVRDSSPMMIKMMANS